MNTYKAWTRSNSNDQWIISEITAKTISEARIKFLEQGREIEKGTLRKKV